MGTTPASCRISPGKLAVEVFGENCHPIQRTVAESAGGGSVHATVTTSAL
jgi:hypothetical protein